MHWKQPQSPTTKTKPAIHSKRRGQLGMTMPVCMLLPIRFKPSRNSSLRYCLSFSVLSWSRPFRPTPVWFTQGILRGPRFALNQELKEVYSCNAYNYWLTLVILLDHGGYHPFYPQLWWGGVWMEHRFSIQSLWELPKPLRLSGIHKWLILIL